METFWSEVAYLAGLFVASGFIVLRLDVSTFTDRVMVREAVWSRVLGWLNVAVGILLYAVQWAFYRWFWPGSGL